jgi:hypothetical protein
MSAAARLRPPAVLRAALLGLALLAAAPCSPGARTAADAQAGSVALPSAGPVRAGVTTHFSQGWRW